jgi:hypothetical protein
MDRVFDWLSLLLVVAVFFLFFRPGSLGPKVADTVGDTLVNLVQSVTGGGGWWQ